MHFYAENICFTETFIFRYIYHFLHFLILFERLGMLTIFQTYNNMSSVGN